MADRADQVMIRFSRRELALLSEAVAVMPIPQDHDDARLVLDLWTLLDREARKGAK